MNIGIAITRAASVTPTWSTVDLSRAALEAGHVVRFIEPWDFEINHHGELVARAHTFREPLSNEAITEMLWRRSANRHYIQVAQLDLLLLRASPISRSLLSFAMQAKDRGVQVINDPDGILRVSNKAWLAGLRGVPTPVTVVTKSYGIAKSFYEEQKTGVILKPAIGSGGASVFRVKPGNDNQFEEYFSHVHRHKNGHVVVQAYLEAAQEGETRIVWFKGKAIGGYLRQAAAGEFRHNLKCGATPLATTLSPRHEQIVATLRPHLSQNGVLLAGIDVIGDKIIEVNALNPGGIYHASRLSGVDLAHHIMHSLQILPFAAK
jgi:glutathione synthase